MIRSNWLARSAASISPGARKVVMAAAMSLAASPLQAGDCHCHQGPHHVSDTYCDCQPDWGKPAGHGPIYKTLDAFAGGIEKLFRLGPKGNACDAACDDACDAAMIDELSQPAWPLTMSQPGQPGSEPARPRASTSPAPSAARDPLRMSSPKIQPLSQNDIPERRFERSPRGYRPAPQRSRGSESPSDRRRVPAAGSDASEGAPADALSDPFVDDSVRLQRRGKPAVQLSSHEAARAPHVSKRRLKSVR